MIAGLFVTLVLAIGASVWYYKERSTLVFAIALCLYAALGLIVVKHLAVLVFIAIVAAVVYAYTKKPEVIDVAKKVVDEKIDTMVDTD